MAKNVYKIPADLNRKMSDVEIAVTGENGVGVKPTPIKTILAYIGSALVCFYLCANTALSLSVVYWLPFTLVWAVLSFMFFKQDKTKRMQFELLPSFLNYINKTTRHLDMTEKANPYEFISICGIDDVDIDKGVITYTDGTYGVVYRVIGSASILLFDDDKNDIINHIDAFYRKISNDCELIFITTKEAQKVYRQIANLKRRYDRLDVRDDDLDMLAREQFYVLKNDIGDAFRSIHQYMILKADNKEALLRNKNIIQAEYENSSLMFKQCVSLVTDDIYDVLATIYK